MMAKGWLPACYVTGNATQHCTVDRHSRMTPSTSDVGMDAQSQGLSSWESEGILQIFLNCTAGRLQMHVPWQQRSIGIPACICLSLLDWPRLHSRHQK